MIINFNELIISFLFNVILMGSILSLIFPQYCSNDISDLKQRLNDIESKINNFTPRLDTYNNNNNNNKNNEDNGHDKKYNELSDRCNKLIEENNRLTEEIRQIKKGDLDVNDIHISGVSDKILDEYIKDEMKDSNVPYLYDPVERQLRKLPVRIFLESLEKLFDKGSVKIAGHRIRMIVEPDTV